MEGPTNEQLEAIEPIDVRVEFNAILALAA